MLYIVGTPIGNLKDISLRALEVLKQVDIVACEDTRNSIKLLNHYDIKKKLISYHKFNEKQQSEEIVKLLLEGKNIALVSDCGLPIISDPGNILVKVLKENHLEYTVIPGATASLSALLLSGFESRLFTFVGFLPEKNTERTNLLNSLKNLNHTLIFYISPHSLIKDTQSIFEILGARHACFVKEITKIHETVYDFVLGQEIEINAKGEFVLIVEGNSENTQSKNSELSINEQIELLKNQGITENQAISKTAKQNNMTKQELYKILKVK